MRTVYLFALLGLFGAAPALADPAPNWILPDANDQSLAFYDDAGDRAAILLFPTASCKAACLENLQHWASEAAKLDAKIYWLSSGRTPALAPAAATQLFNARFVARQYGAGQNTRVVLVNSARQKVWVGPAQSEPEAVLNLWREQWLAPASRED